ncbi:MAG TPA: serine/threonine-protein kinase [Acidimicrobiales bacterium]|nr:serine/threonine-protein kinase [Acidimicrobiales bacterium]
MVQAAPPDLPGYDYLRELGHGGFADVYLFRQHLPSREVAVKVLRQTTSSTEDRDQFENEANRMAMLSSHPGIVTIYEVGVAPDDRPYITMEYCPHDHFGRIARAHPLTVARALEVGIKVAAAVETAHHAAILHRDVKPANILLTTYGEPALADFGIAGGIDGDVSAASQGVSIPFAAPEVLTGATVGDELSDVYSLGATVYALLAGRSPFSTGEPLSEVDLIQRILHAPLPPTGRADVPPSLERVLANAIARDPATRYESAAALGRALQGVEAELGLAQTPLRIADTSSVPPPRTPDPDDDDSTRFRPVQRVDPDGPAARPARISGVPSSPTAGTPVRRDAPAEGWSAPAPPVDSGLGDRTVQRGRASDDGSGAQDPRPDPSGGGRGRPDRRKALLSIAGAVVVIAAVAFVLSKAGGQADGGADPTTTTPDTSPLVTAGAPARPERVRIETDGAGQRITWSAPSSQEGDAYQVFFTDGPSELAGEATVVRDTELRIDTDRRVCVLVETVRDGRVSDASAEVCTP